MLPLAFVWGCKPLLLLMDSLSSDYESARITLHSELYGHGVKVMSQVAESGNVITPRPIVPPREAQTLL